MRLLALMLFLGFALAADYYPHGLGYFWKYSSGEVQRFVRVKELAGSRVWMLEHTYADGARLTEAMSFRDDGVWVFAVYTGAEAMYYEPPLKLYPPPPLKVGDSWGQTTRLKGRELVVSSEVVGIKGVSVPAGRFNAFVIENRMRAEGGSESLVFIYFVPGVGVVRYLSPDGAVIDLVEFSLEHSE